MNFDESARYLLGLGHETVAIKLGLDNITRLLERVHTRRVTFDELSDLQGAQLFFTNVNTPEDYARALRAAEARP